MGTDITVALVSTNSITQGENVSILWDPLFRKGIHIDFAHRTFRWDSEASSKAHVHCVIIGFSACVQDKEKKIFENGNVTIATNINGYLVDASNVSIMKRSTSLCPSEKMVYGSEPREGGYLILSEEERKELVAETPEMEKYINRFVSSDDYINNNIRYCLWLENADMSVVRKSAIVKGRLAKCKEFRQASKQAQAHKAADTPFLFASPRQPKTEYLLIPVVSSEGRRYIPIGYVDKDIIASNACFTVPNATAYTFGVLTSNVHMAWMRTVAGRLKSDYRYSNTIVYNNFP